MCLRTPSGWPTPSPRRCVTVITPFDPYGAIAYAAEKSDPTRAPLRNPRTLAQTDGQPDGFRTFLIALRDEVVAFRKPVAYVHGDSHTFRIDRPVLDASGRRLENFTRVETFGNAAERPSSIQAGAAISTGGLRTTFSAPRERY